MRLAERLSDLIALGEVGVKALHQVSSETVVGCPQTGNHTPGSCHEERAGEAEDALFPLHTAHAGIAGRKSDEVRTEATPMPDLPDLPETVFVLAAGCENQRSAVRLGIAADRVHGKMDDSEVFKRLRLELCFCCARAHQNAAALPEELSGRKHFFPSERQRPHRPAGRIEKPAFRAGGVAVGPLLAECNAQEGSRRRWPAPCPQDVQYA